MNEMLPSLVRVLCRGALVFALTAAETGASDAGGLAFSIDQRNGSIGFSVDHLGLFSTRGQFDRFTGSLDIDPAHPERSSFKIRVDTTSIDSASAQARAMLRGSDFFNVERYPVLSYDSTSVTPMPGQHYAITGVLEMRGVARPQPLDALRLSRKIDPQRQVEIDDFAVTGRLKRSDFGMVTNQVFISDLVTLTIHVRLELPLSTSG